MELQENYPFLLHWVWGHQSNIPPINISAQKMKRGVFYAAGSVGVCYDWIKNKQHLLLGHKNDIISIAATPDNRYLVSADSGEENTLIIWHAETGDIYHILYSFPCEGVISMCFSSDGNDLMTLTGGIPQEISIWDWKNKALVPVFSYKYKENNQFQHYIIFHSVFSSHFASCGSKSVQFFERSEGSVKSAVLDVRNLYDEKASNQMGCFTQTAFSIASSLAVTATTKGMIVLWGRALYRKEKEASDSIKWLFLNPEHRVCIRMVQVVESRCPISFLSSVDTYFVVGTAESKIIYYNENFSIIWSKCFDEDHINGVSFLYKPKLGIKEAVRKLLGKKQLSESFSFEGTDFILSTFKGFVGYYTTETKKMEQILWGTNLIKYVAVHRIWPYIYFGDYNGCLQKWNYATKQILNVDVYQSSCAEIEVIAVDEKGAYAACVMSNGYLAIFDAVCFSSKPVFTADEIVHKPTMIHFSPDSQHLLVMDASSNITHYRLQLLVVPKGYQKIQKEKKPSEEPFWLYAGKSRQHQGRIVDSMFNIFKKNETLYFYTLGEDRFLVEYNISNSKGLDIEISKRIVLDRKPIPMCMTWYPLYDLSSLIAVLNNDGTMRVYSIETEETVKIVSLPVYEEPIKRIFLQTKWKYLLTKEFPNYTNISDVFQYFIFNCSHMIGLSKFPIDGNPNTSLGLTSTPSGINHIVSNKDLTYIFTTGLNDSWIFMYEINILSVLEAEREGGEGIDAFKYLFPTSCDPDEMKKKFIYGVYSLELERKMLEFGKEHPILKGEVPINFLQYVLAAIGCFISPNDLNLMLRDVEFENKHLYKGKKRPLSCLDIMKLYVSYRPAEPITKDKLKESFKDVLSFEEDPDKLSRNRIIDILTTRGDALSHRELLNILKCLNNAEDVNEKNQEDSVSEGEVESSDKESRDVTSEVAGTEFEVDALSEFIPEYVTEEVFLQDIVCLESAEEDFSNYILKKEDYKQVQEYPKLKDFIAALQNK